MPARQSTALHRPLLGAALLTVLWLSNAGCRPPKSELSSTSGQAGQGEAGSGQEVSASSDQGAGEQDRNVPAAVGVGKQGQGFRDRDGYLSTAGSAFFDTKQKIIFDIKLPHAMNLFKAEHGRLPKTEEEFFEKVIKGYEIELPELPEEHSYFYDAKTGLLMVRQPAGQDR
jgi:hypothetical protein